MREDGKISEGSIGITFDEHPGEWMEVLFETDIVEKGGYTYPEITITAFLIRGERLDNGPFFDLLVSLTKEIVYEGIKREAEE